LLGCRFDEGLCLPRRKHHRRKTDSRKLTIAFIVFVGACTILAFLAYLGFFQQEKFVSAETMEKYAKTLITDYNQSIDFFIPSTFNQFSFYSNGSYNVTGIISSSYGTALLFYPSAKWSFKNQTTNQRIEDAIFGEYNSQLPTKFIFNGNDTGFNGDNGTVTNIGMIISNDSSAIFTNVNIDTVHYYCLILKGNNETSFWNTQFALNDSKLIFDRNLYWALQNSEEVRERYAEPELNKRLVDILTKWNQALQPNGNVSYTYTQKEYDIEQVEELAKTYGITNSSQFINSLLNYLKNATLPLPPPPKTIFTHIVNDPDNWLYVVLLGGFPVLMYGTYLLFDYLRTKYPSKGFRYLLGIPLAVLSVGFSDLVYGYPYDYSLVSWQSFVVVLIWSGILWIYLVRKKLVSWMVAKKENTHNTQNNPEQKAKKTVKSKKP
jgi:hypothetical protein